ncbi:uncharacterized protein LOC105837746 isoform X2 [Monomorium pharaonis]|uniref:uncharacterized protein LOC105837746 isoform X2 n=1 Tax=Monomorium pharaonis TaxID=307658 RepID=UPI001746251E|nr:uncharacterized protein LOC105837746 isoform X2 [Monomorium pharaonis]
MKIDQLGLLLWKNYVIRKRQPGILALIFIWPVVVFMIMYTVSDNTDLDYHPTCQFPARSMPQDGLLPFVQNYICSVGNPCDPLPEYEEVPTYQNTTLGPLIGELQPMLNNETVISAVETLPQSIKLLKSMAEILTKPEIKALFDRGIRLGDLFNNHEQIKSLLRTHMPGAREGFIDGLFESSVKLIYLIKTFGSSNINGVICSPESLRNYLIVSKEEDITEISNVLCNIDSLAIPDILENLSKHLDFTGLLEMVDRAMATFRDYDFFQDLKRTTETILDLKISKKYIPEYLRIREWLPKIMLLFRNVTFKEIDLNFINNAFVVLDPVFAYERDWPIARSGLLKINRLLKMVKEYVKNNGEASSTEDFFSVMNRLSGKISSFSSNPENYENITQILDLASLILQDGMKLTNKLLDRHASDFELAAEVFDGLRGFFSENIVNSATYLISLTDNIVQMTHHVAIVHEETLQRLYDITKRHQILVQKIVTNLQPAVYRTMIRSFSRLDFVERFVEKLKKRKLDDVFCQEDTMREIFENYVEFGDKSNEINDLFCGNDGRKFITDVYDSFEFDKFGKIVSNALSTMVSMAFKQLVKVENSNLTSVVRNIKGFVNYLDTRKVTYLNWSIFQTSDEWKNTFNELQLQGRLDILGIHLSIAKMLGFRSLSYTSIKPDLENMDLLADIILQDLRINPSNWIGKVRQHKAELIESFYLTVTDRKKALQILEYSNFTRSYCVEPNPPDLLNFPKESNSTVLKNLTCYLSKTVQRNLDLNLTKLEMEEATYRQREFNWTAFNEKTIEIYKYVDTLVHQEDQSLDSKKLEKLKQNFKTSWTTDVTAKDAWEISVGLICKLFDVMESPLFRIQSKKNWKNMYGLGWATSVIFDNIEKIVDQIQKRDHVAKLSDVLREMPQTEILVGTFLRNLSPVILDVVDMITLRPVPLISALDDYKERETMWPCVFNESVGAALELRNGSREVVRELEKIACDPSLFIKEWREQPIIMRVRKMFEQNETAELPSFNWTRGYTNFRRLVTKLDDLINDAKEVVLAEEPQLAKYLKTLATESNSIVEERFPAMQSDWRYTLDHVDLEMDKAIKSFGSDLSARELWKPSVSVTDRVLISLKYISHIIHKSSRIIIDILQSGTGKISLLSLLGFDNTSPVTIFYNQLPFILSTVINGISDPVMDDHIVTALENNSTITCSMLFDWLSDFKVGLSNEEYRTLKNFTCDLDPENFNVYTDLYMAEVMIWNKPTSRYRSFVASIIGDLYDAAERISLTVRRKVTIEPLFSKKYLEHLLQMLKESLEVRSEEGTFHKELQPGQDWLNYRLLIEGMSEVLVHIGNALKNAELHDYKLETWQLAENGDTRQLLKILEAYPEETVALIAILSTLDYTTGDFVPFKDLRKTMCTQHFNSNYWSTARKTRFLQEVCSFDPYQLLKTATSDEYYEVVTGRKTALSRSTPLTLTLTRLLDIVSNFTVASPGASLSSNIFNVTTWKNLSNETWALILKSEKSWIHQYRNSAWYRLNVTSHGDIDYLVGSRRMFQLLESAVDLTFGGDIWQKLRVMYESSKLQPLLTLVEDMPNLLITAVDTFVSSERLDDFMQKLFLGQVHPCNIDRYLIPPSYMRKRGLLASITNFCQKIVMSNEQLTWTDLLPFNKKYNNFTPGMPEPESVYEEQLLQSVQRFQDTLIRDMSEGFKQPKIPAWWTSFEEGTLKDFNAQYKKKDSKTLAYAMVKKSMSVLKHFLETQESAENCTWCSTLSLEILNSQLVYHNLYSKLLCRMNRLNITEVHNILINDFNWNKTASMVKDYKYLNKKKTLDEYLNTLEITLHYIADIVIDFQNETYSNRVNECYNKFVGGPTYSRPGLYITLLLSVLDMLEKNVYILDSASIHEGINNLTRLAEKHVPIWKPLREVVKKSDLAEIDAALPNATINVNAFLSDLNRTGLCRTKIDCQNATVLYKFLNSKRAGKVFRYDPKASNYPSVSDISSQLARSLDVDLISRQLYFWRTEASWNLFWLKEILIHLSAILEEGRNLLDVASKIDFEDITGVLGVPDLVEGIVNVVKDKTVDKLFDGMKELLEDVEPFISNHEIIDDLNTIITTLESMEIFKNLGLLDMKYVVREMFDNWDFVRTYLVDKINITNEIALTLGQAKIDMISVFMQERGIVSLKDTICSPEKLSDMLHFDNNIVTAEEVSSTLCQLEDSQTQDIAIMLMKNLNFDYIFRNLMSANVKSILANANLTETEGKIILDNLGVAAELFPFFKDKLAATFSSFATDESNAKETDEAPDNSQFLKDSSKLLCGRTLIQDEGQMYKIIASLKDSNKESDQKELESLPDTCKETYKTVLAIPGGKIVWSYVKPLLRGQILYAPNTPVINEIMALTNNTFVQMEHFGVLVESIEKSLKALANLTEMGDSLKELQNIMSSDVMKVAIKSMGGGNFEGDLSELNISEIAWRLKKSKKLISMIGMLNSMMGCVLVNRTIGFPTEEELEVAASRLTETNEFLAGVIFMNDASSHPAKRSLESELPDDITYKIRMDVDYVPSTTRLKTQFWIPGPESSFIEHLRYLRGFIQLQDSVDRAIIKVKTRRYDLNWRTVTQQMPYPCWKEIPFQTTLYESQGLQVCFFFALMMCVGSAVRHIVWERESQNSMVMSVMGLKPWRNTLAWFITSYAEVSIVMISISIILLAGKILPRSDPFLVLILLFDYSFSVVTFCYMISTMFSSASLSAVTTVIMFLLTYMPYMIVIAMEAVFGLGFKLFICLSMSTSFCYGCLFTVRKEVQGVGLSWANLWEESNPGDSMTLGLLLIMIALDGCLYAVIGCLIARYTDSDDESDLSNLTVTEKQIGVKFESVRKVYNTERGDVVAVEDFTLKLCEGEVTSLLGRNGAGKTTIIKMLTGMVAPTNGEICLNGEEGCKPDIGVCPQENVLIGSLTPREHLVFYWKLKRPNDDNNNMQRNVNGMLASLELGRQEHEPVSRLSGGTRRRLCVALAFLGSPRLVILDEPGAGVDPAARRRIWRLIDQHRIGRTVLLSTHHLDEADMLSDTVVVMHKGKILCTGSPLTLKVTHGTGYRLNIAFPPDHYPNGEVGIGGIAEPVDKKNLKALRTVVEEIMPNSTMNEVSESEVTIMLPFQGKNGINNDIAQVAKALEDNHKLLGFSHFSLECDTLERVFLDLCARADNGSSVIRASQDSVVNVDHGAPTLDDNVDLITDMVLKPSPIRQMKAMIKKRIWHFARDWRAPLAALVLPTMFVAVAMGFSLIRPPSENEPPLALTPKLYDTQPTYFYSINSNDPFLQHVSMQLHDRFGDDYAGAWQTLPNDTGTCECIDGQQTCRGLSKPIEGLLQTLPGRPTLDWIVSTHQEYIERRYGGWSLSHSKEDPLFIVWYNNKGHHAMPGYLNALNEAILRASGIQGHLTTFNHPLKLSSDQLNRMTIVQHVADVGVALVLLIAFSMVAAQGTKEIVRERLTEEKRILYLAGVHPITYWTTILICDFIVFSCALCLAVIVFEIFGLSAYVARDNLAGVCLILILFAWAALPFSHLAEKAFDDSSLSNMVLFCVNTFIGVVCLATILVLDILGKTKAAEDVRNMLHHILMIFPQYILADGLVAITRNDITAELLQRFHMDTYKSPLSWDLLGYHFVSLFIIGTILFVLNLIIECRVLPDLRRQKVTYETVQEDDDVARERLRIETGMVDDTLKTMKLRKEYKSVYGTNVAVQNLSFGVQAGKCFGLLGVNGAGKSTTFKMLTTEIVPTAGKIILKGNEIGAGPLCNGEVGYCPQSDALDGFLTPHQCLTIHGEVCGLSNVPKAVETTLKRFDLLKYAHRRVSGLSGGNKRKLCAAISVMAPAAVILMDEPTSGMDPATKNLVARAVRQVTRSQGCVILTSHSVAECENLCTRVGILARAGLRCIGTPQHLKHKFGEGYVAFLRFGQPVSAADLRRVILKYLPQAMISSRQATAARILLPRSQDMALSVSFSKLKLLAEELKATDYTLTQSSLDQVLVTFSEELDDDAVDVVVFGQNSRNSVPNMYSSMDTIHMDTF